ncbi:hypothetical protein F442_16699, partial [Phytophthora nicotianae P10297]
DGKTALHLATLLKNIPITKALLDKGASMTAVDQLGLLVTTEYWHKCFFEGKPLMLVPSEVIKGGGATVDTYLNAMNETADGQLVKRCKISGVGPSTWGKLHLSRHCRR